MKNFLSILDLTKAELLHLIARAEFFRTQKNNGQKHTQFLEGKNIALFFEKPSLRTKVSFESAVSSLGGNAIYIDGREVAGPRESISDIAHVLTGLVDGVFGRVFEHSVLSEFAEIMDIPVMNALCDEYHPFQALAELQAIEWNCKKEGKNFFDQSVVFIGDGCNVAVSLAQGCVLAGLDFTMCSPKGYEIPHHEWEKIIKISKESGSKITLEYDPAIAIKNSSVVVTDTWISMGKEQEKQQRIKHFKGFQVTNTLLEKAQQDAIFLHCLPAYRGMEVSSDVIDGPKSWVFQESHCRLHTSKAVLEFLYQKK